MKSHGLVVKNKRKGGEEKMKKLFFVLLTALFVMGIAGISQAEIVGTSKTVAITATITGQSSGMDMTISKVTVADCTGTRDTTWTVQPTLTMPMGTLGFDVRSGYNVFRTGTAPNFTDSFYYAMDIGVIDNSGRDWYITHTPNSIAGSVSGNLNDKVNVAFAKVTGGVLPDRSDDTVTNLDKLAFGSSSKQITKTDIGTAGWLRIYYGIGSGIGPTTPNPNNCQRDASGVSPITLSNTAVGTYTGSVTLSLTFR